MSFNAKDEIMVKTLFGCKLSDIARNVIISPVWSLDSFAGKGSVIKSQFKGWYKGITVTYKGKDVTIINSCIGSPLTGDCVIGLGHTICENILFSGSAGGLSERYDFGDIVVCNSAVIGEGFSRYHTEDFTIDPFGREVAGSDELAETLYKMAKGHVKGLGVSIYNGKIFSTDSILGENKRSFDYMIEKGCHGVEMEMSAVFTASKCIGRNAAGLVTISDMPLKHRSLFDGTKDEDIMRYRESAKVLPEILLDAAIII